MSFDLDKVKLQQLSDKLQVVVFNLDGKCLASCDSILTMDMERSLFDQFLFLMSLQEVFTAMPVGESQRFSEVEWQEERKGLFHLIFEKQDLAEYGEVIQWTIIDNTFYYDKLLNLQQSRNDSAISEEFAQIQKRMIEAENELLAYKNEELTRIQQFKSDFFAKVSHEMRTPLNSISGLVDLMGKQSNDDYQSALKSTSKHLNSIINDILDLSKIEAGKLEFEEMDFELNDLLQSIVTGFQFTCQQKGIALNFACPESTYVKGDPTRLSQVIYNLLGNSIKFTSEGAVGLTATESNGSFEFSITDSGIGMDQETLQKILEPYAQASGETTRLYGGTGLGLSIAKQLIEAMGGVLAIESEVGTGTAMSFSIEMAVGEAAAVKNELVNGLSGLQVVLAEDDDLSAKVLSEQLRAQGAEVQRVDNGEALVETVTKGNPDFVITDINLEGKSGLDAFKAIRDSGHAVPFIILSGEAIDKRQLQAYSSWAFLQKPVETAELFQAIQSVMENQGPSLKVDLSRIKKMIPSEEVVQDLLQTILRTLPDELDKLSRAWSEKDLELIRKTLHKIKPSIDYLGIPMLQEQRQALHENAGHPSAQSLEDFDKHVRLALIDLKVQLD